MRAKLNINLPKLSNENDFESLLRDICAFEWNDPATEKFGRKGQKQFGVDVYGRPDGLLPVYRGVQCKHRATDKQLSQNEIEKEVAEAKLFPHKLDRLIIATDGPRNNNTQILINGISESELNNGGFQVNIWFWDDISERLAAYPQLMISYYKDLYKNLSTFPLLEKLNDLPIHILLDSQVYSQSLADIVNNLQFRGVRILGQKKSNRQQSEPGCEIVDGVICNFIEDNEDIKERSLFYFLGILNDHAHRLDRDTPIFVLLHPKSLVKFTENANKLNLDLNRFSLLMADQSAIDIADHIFSIVFPYGYKRRGALNAFNVLARTREVRVSGILLDINLQEKLGTEIFPTKDEWENQIIPALRSIRNQIMSQGETPRIQFDSQLPIPAAVALGFYFNLRVATVGVWARTIASSDFKKQFWLSDAYAKNVIFKTEWLPQENNDEHHAILEISSYLSIHQSVQTFVDSQDLKVNKWGRINLEIDGNSQESIEEGTAVAFANSVGQIVRQLNSQGITDVHLFARIPSALAVLIGQRLYACGRIHLYWFENPTYRYAFQLS